MASPNIEDGGIRRSYLNISRRIPSSENKEEGGSSTSSYLNILKKPQIPSPEYKEVGGSIRRSYSNILKKHCQMPSFDNKEEGGTSTSPCFSQQPILIPPDFEHDWRYGKYVVDSEGYSIKVNHFSDDEVSEEECDSDDDNDDDDDDKKNKKSTLPAALKSVVASISKKLPMAMKIGKSSDKSHLEETEDREYIPIPIPVPPHDSKGVCLITFDGFHKEGTNGGYGAMLRHGNGTPIAAVAGGSEHSISAYYHTLEGLKSGLEAAQKLGIKSVYLVCNSERVCLTVRGAFISLDEGDCGYHPPESFKVVCRPCLQGMLSMNEPFDSVLKIMTDILTIGKCYYRSNGMVAAHVKEWNKPADYLAKLVRNPGEHKIFPPDVLPDDLLTLLNEHGGRIPMIID